MEPLSILLLAKLTAAGSAAFIARDKHSNASEGKTILTYSAASQDSPIVEQWDRYRLSLGVPAGPLSPYQAALANEMWQQIREHLALPLPPPHAAVAEDGTFVMSWDRGSHHLEIELFPDGRYDWFYMDEAGPERGGEEQRPSGTLSPDLLRLLGRTVREQWTS